MAQQIIDTTTPNGSYIGDPAVTAFGKVNYNFSEIYSGNMTFAGNKTFTGKLQLSGQNLADSATVLQGDATQSRFTINDASGRRRALIYNSFANDASSILQLSTYNASGSSLSTLAIGSGGATIAQNFGPATDNAVTLGTASARWTSVYAVNTTISNSDARLKTEPRDMLPAEVAAFGQIARLPMVWQWLSRFESEGNAARLHAGPTVQAAIEAMTANGLDWTLYSAFCHDAWEAEEALVDEAEGVIIRSARAAGDVYSFRKEELLWWCMRALAQEHDALAARITVLEAAA